MTASSAQTKEYSPHLSSNPLLFWGWGAMVLGMFMAILDIMIVASSLNEIQASLAISPDNIGWVQTSYLIAEVIMIPLSAFLSQLLSSKRVFIISAGGFTIMSLACAVSWSLESLVIFRILQGFLGGAMIPITFAVATLIYPKEKLNRATIIMGLVVTMAPAVGPALGGWITEYLSWRWLFLINFVPGLIVVALVITMPSVDKPNSAKRHGFDTVGLFVMAVFLGSLMFVLHEGAQENWFEDNHVTLFFVVSLVAGSLFIWRMYRFPRPIVDLGIFRNRSFTIGTVFGFVQGFGMYGVTYTTTLFLGRVAALNALQIGTIMAVTGLAQFFSSPIVEWLAKYIKLRLTIIIGLVLFTTALYLNSHHTSQSRFNEFLLPQTLWGAAIMFMFLPINSITFSTLKANQLKDASALHNLLRNLGGAVALAMIDTLLHQKINLHRNWLISNVNTTNSAYQNTKDLMLGVLDNRLLQDPETTVVQLMDQLVNQQAIVLAFNDIHIFMAWVFGLSLILVPLASWVHVEPKLDK